MDHHQFKLQIINHCTQTLQDQISSLEQELALIKHDIAEDTKSSAGDKYETSREMANMERQKLAEQLAVNNKLMGYISTLNTDPRPEIQAGALVETDKVFIFISISLGLVEVEGRRIMVISPNAPLSQAFLGARPGDEISFNKQVYRIISIS